MPAIARQSGMVPDDLGNCGATKAIRKDGEKQLGSF